MAKSASKICLTIILERKNVFLDSKIGKSKKLKNWDFSKGGQSMVSVKNLKIFHVSIFGKIKQENVFEDILGRKKSFFRL